MRRTSKKPKLLWERAYKGHAYWLGKHKLGKVSVLADPVSHSGGKYQWEAAGKMGAAADLAEAKRAVEQAVAMADKQLDLFT